MTCVAACSHRPAAPIEERDGGGIARPEQRYTVLRGDTLYSIAFRHGLDYRRLAAANAIPAPYVIYPGQGLILAEAEVTPSRSPASAAVVAPPAPRPTAAGDAAGKAAATATPEPPVPARSETRPVRPPLASSGDPPDRAVSSWRWPADGRVTRGFDGNLHKGVDIACRRGDAVSATAAARVVYAGSGIAGYGLLLILRHNDAYLSAYGHNDSLLVAEGEVVRPGQAVARCGSTGTDGVKLHFEIRQRGRPVDPLGLLPRR